jgi:CRISPR/Cas system-associated exonuclease Cas4 (RecB family)
MSQQWLPFVSFSLMSQFEPGIGQEFWHCDMKRGFARVRKNELSVKALLAQDTPVQRIGLLAQQGVYFFHSDEALFEKIDGVQKVAQYINLAVEEPIVQLRVLSILQKYYDNSVLRGKRFILLAQGNEGFPEPIEIKQDKVMFKLFFALDCVLREESGKVHILDFKTGQSSFDRRQAYIYLIVGQNLYPGEDIVASFYNLETNECSEKISATPNQLQSIQVKLARLAKRHELEKKQYRNNPNTFEELFPPNPDFKRCSSCQFNTVCSFSFILV